MKIFVRLLLFVHCVRAYHDNPKHHLKVSEEDWCDPRLCWRVPEAHVACGYEFVKEERDWIYLKKKEDTKYKLQAAYTYEEHPKGNSSDYCGAHYKRGPDVLDINGKANPKGKPNSFAVSDVLAEYFLDRFNEYRNRVASGKVAGLKPASGMKQLYWDKTLSTLAMLPAKYCYLDICRNTHANPYAGQIVYQDFSNFNPSISLINILSQYDTYGQNDKTKFNMSIVHKVPPKWTNQERAPEFDFLQVVHDKCERVGCAAAFGPAHDTNIQTTDREGNMTFTLVCNFGRSPIVGMKAYKVGDLCSKCPNGCSKEYPALCEATDSTVSTPVSATACLLYMPIMLAIFRLFESAVRMPFV